MAAVETCGRYFWVGGQHGMNEWAGNRRTVNEFLPEEQEWVNRKEIPLQGGLGHVSASVMPFRCGVLVVGGVTRNVKTVNDVLYYMPWNDSWAKIGEFPRKVQTPVCGLKEGILTCGTGGGEPWVADAFYKARIY